MKNHQNGRKNIKKWQRDCKVNIKETLDSPKKSTKRELKSIKQRKVVEKMLEIVEKLK